MALGALKAAMAFTMALLFGTLAAVFGIILWLAGPGVGIEAGLGMAAAFAVIVTGLQWYFAPSIIRFATRMRELKPSEYPWLHEILETHSKKAGVKKPRLYLVMDGTPNAFAFGRTKNNSNVAVHSGLLNTLTKEEVEGVIAHEVGHIRHWDVVVITVASMVPLLVYYAIVFAGSMFLGRERERGTGGGMLAVWLGAYAAQFLSFLLVMHLSRTREYYADAFSAVSTGKPALLRSALAKIAYGFPQNVNPDAYRDKRAFYITDPVEGVEAAHAIHRREAVGTTKTETEHAIEWEKQRGFFELFSTHPMTYKRLEALKKVEEELKAGRLSLAAV